MPKKQVDKVLVLARREDLCNYAKRLATDLGFEAYGALNNEEGKALLEGKHTFCACVLGNVLVNDQRFTEELKEMKYLLDERSIPTAPCPTFGDSRAALETLGLVADGKKVDAEAAATEAAASVGVAA